MLLINLATIYQGAIPTLRHTQAHAYQLSKIHLRYTLTGELDSTVPQIIQELSNTELTRPWPPPTVHPTPQTKQTRYSTRIRPKQNNQTLSQHPTLKTLKRRRMQTKPTLPHPTHPTHQEPPPKRNKPDTITPIHTPQETPTPNNYTTTLAQPQQRKKQNAGRRRCSRFTHPTTTLSQLNLLQSKAWIPNIQQKTNQPYQTPPSHPDQSNKDTSPQPHPPTTPITPPNPRQ
jgi:hypothetical protein